MKKRVFLNVERNVASIFLFAGGFIALGILAYPSTGVNFFDTRYSAIDGVLCLCLFGTALAFYTMDLVDPFKIRAILWMQRLIMGFVFILFLRYKVDVAHNYLLENFLACLSMFGAAWLLIYNLRLNK